MKCFALSLLIMISHVVYSQRDFNWVFGDSIGINFNTSPPTVDTNRIIDSYEPSASISDLNGNLLFYVGSADRNDVSIGCKKYVVRCSNDSVMPGGDSLAGDCSMTQGLIILPESGDINKFYIFHIKYPGNFLYYSIVDMSLNNGLGEIITSNNLLFTPVLEKMHAVKLGNGKGWWLLNTSNSTPCNFVRWKIDSIGISPAIVQNISIPLSSGQMIFSPNGDKLLFAGGGEVSFLFDFDRCTGAISNPQYLLHAFSTSSGLPRIGCSFSLSGRYAYLSSADSLWQFDTHAANVEASKLLVFNISPAQPSFQFGIGQHMLAPDGKIYISSPYNPGWVTANDSIITHLTVINYPDSAGIACNVEPYSFSLNGRKSYLNLPNMPNYNLGPLENVNCDSILAVNEKNEANFSVYPNPGNGKFNIELLKQVENITVDIFSLLGNNIYKNQFYPGSGLLELDLTTLPEGVYLMQVTGESRVLGSRKIVIMK